MYPSLIAWLERFPSPLQDELRQMLDVCTNYFTGKKELFKPCGFYVVGSSLTKAKYDDIDLVLVGLDFRQVFKYTPGFLSMDDLPDSVKAMKEPDCDLSHYCTSEISGQPELYELARRIMGQVPYSTGRTSWDTPFSAVPYVHDCLGEWLVSRIELYKGEDRWKKQKPTLDLMFHAENMLVSSWKRTQEAENLPYLPVIELYDPAHDSIENRPAFESKLPDFVDAQGEKSMKMQYYGEKHRRPDFWEHLENERR